MTSRSGGAASDGPRERVSEEHRQDVLERLRRAAVDGLVSLDEFGDRSATALAATTRAELDSTVSDLSVHDQPASGRQTGVILGIFGSGDRSGRWRIPARCIVINLFGGADLDLRGATVTAAESTITVWSMFGGSDVVVPTGVDADVGGAAIFGGNDVDLRGLEPEPGAPTIRIRAYSLFGGTDVSVRAF